MRIVIVHGYLLDGSGSNVYVQNLCRTFCNLGHDIFLFCQESKTRDFDFISQEVTFDAANLESSTTFRRKTPFKGKCICYRPNIGGFLPVYVYDDYPGYLVKTYVDAEKEEIDQYIAANTRALKTIFTDLDFHLLISNHSIMQPLYSSLALEALNKRIPHIAVVHGSCLNFSVRKRELLKEYALHALEKVDHIVLISAFSQKEFIDFFVGRKDLHQKTIVVPAGADVDLFRIISPKEINQHFKSNPTSLLNLEKIRASKGQTITFIGKLLWTKGPHVLLAAAPLILKEHPHAHFIFTGVGSFEKDLKLLLKNLSSEKRQEVLAFFQNSPVANEANPSDSQIFFKALLNNLKNSNYADDYFNAASNLKDRVIFTGYLNHENLRWLLPQVDITVFPSIFPESFGLVAVESLSSGILPLQTNQSGFKDIIASYRHIIKNDSILSTLAPLNLNEQLTLDMAKNINILLKYYQEISKEEKTFLNTKLRKVALENYSWQTVAQNLLRVSQGRQTV